jgi:hypothetical protein
MNGYGATWAEATPLRAHNNAMASTSLRIGYLLAIEMGLAGCQTFCQYGLDNLVGTHLDGGFWRPIVVGACVRWSVCRHFLFAILHC